MSVVLPPIGIPKIEIDTPALLIDLTVMERNIARMAAYFRVVKAKLRPHTKTHKLPLLAHQQIAAGAIGVCCAKLGEAEVMVNGGIRDILIANQVIGRQKIARLVSLAHHSDIMVAVDNPDNVANLSAAAQVGGVTLRVLVEVNVGMNRCGVEPGEPALVLARKVMAAPGLKFAGLMGYEGHLVFVTDYQERAARTKTAMRLLTDTVKLVESAGIPVEIVSAGGTGTYNITAEIPGITEVQAGSYIFMDGRYRNILPDFDCALTLLTTVISRPGADRAVIDAGRKAITDEFGPPTVIGISGAKLVNLSEEHGTLVLEGDARQLEVGDKIELLPSHGDTTINIHSHYFAIRNGSLEAIWEIAGRGKFR
ncbi:MAG: DSD1 family PLP-dependent enzyme [Dehalococcoidales bacterium]|nr:DSD1 family PLP-dependent enzyme [Dehalococcoidales bacterium]